MSATLLLGDSPIGRIEVSGDTFSVVFTPEYARRPDRPILGQWFEDQALEGGIHRVNALPAFFRNLLPEGALRKIIEQDFARSARGELDMLLALGEDLPGGVRIKASEGIVEPRSPAAPAAERRAGRLRFSLAGVQLKATVMVEADRVTLPVAGMSADWIAKLPSTSLAELPENEFAVLRWARAAGVEVPEHRLIPVNEIENLPEEYPREGKAVLVRRFDRAPDRRIHQEDFAQVFGLDPDDKYIDEVPEHVHYASIGKLVHAIAGRDDFFSFARRVAFMVLSGNGDAHTKNWALWYPHGRARLSPAYDLVATVAYPRFSAGLALGFEEPEDPAHTPPVPFEAIDYRHFQRLAARVGEDPDEVYTAIKAFVRDARRAFEENREEMPGRVVVALQNHLAGLALK
jgi:serine/threonine-protein kinase HipA